jgi:Protein of unknown function (DUF1559)
MRELLIRYLLGELGEAQRAALDRQLADDAALRRELAHLRTCFAAGSGEADDAPAQAPRGLAERTTELVASESGEFADASDSAPGRPCAAVAAEPPGGVLGWSLADLTVAGGVMLAVSMLLFPALGDSRNATRRNVCQNNQRELWIALTNYADDHGGYFPRIAPHENAGSFAVKLVESHYVNADDLAKLLVCPGAPLADKVRSRQFVMRIPSSAELSAMSPAELAVARRNMSPFYAYRFPYRHGQKYHHIRHNHRSRLPVFSDTSGSEQEGLMSPNHGGSIVQVMNQDGSVKPLRSCTVPGFDDDLFVNALGIVAAGLGRQDTVLGRSEATPAFALPRAHPTSR